MCRNAVLLCVRMIPATHKKGTEQKSEHWVGFDNDKIKS